MVRNVNTLVWLCWTLCSLFDLVHCQFSGGGFRNGGFTGGAGLAPVGNGFPNGGFGRGGFRNGFPQVSDN